MCGGGGGGREGGPSPLPGPPPSICSDCGAHWCWDQPISASASPAASNLIIRSSGGPALTGAQHLHSGPCSQLPGSQAAWASRFGLPRLRPVPSSVDWVAFDGYSGSIEIGRTVLHSAVSAFPALIFLSSGPYVRVWNSWSAGLEDRILNLRLVLCLTLQLIR